MMKLLEDHLSPVIRVKKGTASKVVFVRRKMAVRWYQNMCVSGKSSLVDRHSSVEHDSELLQRLLPVLDRHGPL
ncbi:MAG: hypothetical protein M1587_11530, partial [Thaumarchaeota archaeon]|nr:hypothetical protein [Nitrososphaerota archaeon]